MHLGLISYSTYTVSCLAGRFLWLTSYGCGERDAHDGGEGGGGAQHGHAHQLVRAHHVVAHRAHVAQEQPQVQHVAPRQHQRLGAQQTWNDAQYDDDDNNDNNNNNNDDDKNNNDNFNVKG